ncbi:MFS transporter [Ligilactobacillus agilis]|uniref:MFS transporter n=1 Tax=Ligilactobacillus agilis TaxID=1601 RepID=UPI001958D53D|nr:MFS transporter [Ligilactobacillus agilis]MBM6762644.1 MFS transporter [Ligilactobacillus agilis]
MKKAPEKQIIFKISLLSISLFLMMAPQISSALPLMYKAFPGVNQAAVQTLSTIPNFGIVLGLVISPFLVKFLGEKVTILTGLLLTLISGVFPMFASAYTPILISRFLIGLGIGTFNSLAVSLIPEFYSQDEEEMATMIGYQNVMSSIGAALSSFLVSYLVTISWHAAFAIYFLVIPALILFTLFVPLKKQPVVTSQHEARPKQSINSKVILIAGLMFAIFAFYMPMAYELPSLIVSQQMGTASTAALIAGLSTLIGIPIGASFGFFFKRLHDKIFPLGFILVTLGFLITALSPNIAILFCGVIVLGFGFGLGVPYMYNWLDWSAPSNSVNLATTIVLVLVNVGCALSPSLLALIATPLGLNHPRGIMLISTCAFLVIAIYATIHYLGVHKANVAKEAAHSKEPHNAH